MRSSSIHVQNKTKQTNFEILILISIIFAQSIHNRFCYLILFYHLKKQFYQLYHTILQYTTSKNSIFFPFFLNILFYSFFFFFFFSLPFLLFLPQPLAPASTSSKPIPTTMNLTNHTHHHPYPRPKPIPKTSRPSTPRRSHKLPSPPSTTPLLHHLPPQQNHNKKSIPKSPKSNQQITTNLKPKPKLHSTTIETTTRNESLCKD